MVLLLSGILAISLCACEKIVPANTVINVVTPLSSSEICAIGTVTYPVHEAMIIMAAQKKLVEEIYTDKIWAVSDGANGSFESNLKETIKEFLIKLCTMKQMSDEMDIPVTEAEKESLRKCTQAYLEELSPKAMEELGITEEDIYHLFEKYYIYNRLVDQLSSGLNIEISDNEARVMLVQAIFVKKTESDQKSFLDKIYQEAKAAKEGKDFLALAKKYDQSGKTEFALRRNELPETIDQAAFSLNTGQISKLLECEEGYYILRCENDYDKEATKQNKADMIRKQKDENFSKEYRKFVNEKNIRFNDVIFDEISIQSLSSITPDFFKIYNNAF